MSNPSKPDAQPAKPKGSTGAPAAGIDPAKATKAAKAAKATHAIPTASSAGAAASGPTAAPAGSEVDLDDLAGMARERLLAQRAGAQALAAAVPFNPLKSGEIGLAGGHNPQAGPHQAPSDDMTTASTV